MPHIPHIVWVFRILRRAASNAPRLPFVLSVLIIEKREPVSPRGGMVFRLLPPCSKKSACPVKDKRPVDEKIYEGR